MFVKLNSLLNREMKVYYVTQVLKQGINIKTKLPYYILEYRNMYMYSLFLTTYLNLETHTRIYCKSCLGAWAKIETVIKKHVC